MDIRSFSKGGVPEINLFKTQFPKDISTYMNITLEEISLKNLSPKEISLQDIFWKNVFQEDMSR